MKVRWTPEALRDRAAIWDHLAERDPDAALRMDSLFSEAVAGLILSPHIPADGDARKPPILRVPNEKGGTAIATPPFC